MLVESGLGPSALCTPIVMMRVRSHMIAAATMSKNTFHLVVMSVVSRPVLLAIDAGAIGGVHDIIGVPVGDSFACSSETSETYWSTSCLSAPDSRPFCRRRV